MHMLCADESAAVTRTNGARLKKESLMHMLVL